MQINLPHNYIPRSYQLPFLRAMDGGCRRAVKVWHRRSGKDKTDLNFMIKRMAERVGLYHYFMPTLAMGRKVLWDGIDYDGHKFLDHFPKSFIAPNGVNNSEMKIKTVNGSMFQLIGTDKLEVVGTNPVGAVFGEYSLQNKKGWDYTRPILAENNGWASFNYTPRGYNHAKDLYDMALMNDNWFCELLTVDDTHAITLEAIDDERQSGMSEDMVQQEFYCSFDLGIEGSFYAKLIHKARQEGRIMELRYEPVASVHTAWDLGFADTAIWFYQQIGQFIHCIDYYESGNVGIEHYAEVLESKKKEFGYVYGKHYAPFDSRKGELGTGTEFYKTAKNFGIIFHILEREKTVEQGIERVRGCLPLCRFDAVKCERGLKVLESYRREYNDKMQCYNERPLHDWASHGADAFRYLSMARRLGTGGMTAQDSKDIWNRRRGTA